MYGWAFFAGALNSYVFGYIFFAIANIIAFVVCLAGFVIVLALFTAFSPVILPALTIVFVTVTGSPVALAGLILMIAFVLV